MIINNDNQKIIYIKIKNDAKFENNNYNNNNKKTKTRTKSI